jgi:hypothetical protein
MTSWAKWPTNERLANRKETFSGTKEKYVGVVTLEQGQHQLPRCNSSTPPHSSSMAHAHLSASPATAASHWVPPSSRSFSLLAQTKTVPSSIGTVGLRSWSHRAAAAVVRAATNSNGNNLGFSCVSQALSEEWVRSGWVPACSFCFMPSVRSVITVTCLIIE